MSFSGLPDFGSEQAGEGFRLFAPADGYIGSGPSFVASTSLTIARRSDGVPDFLVEYRRGSSGALYGALTFRVDAREPTAAAVRALTPASVRQVPFERGFLRLRPLVAVPDLTPALLQTFTQPVDLAWNPTSLGVFRILLPAGAVEFVKGALTAQTLVLTAYAEMEIEGVAPRCDVTLEFDPKALLNALRKDGDVIEWDALLERLREAIMNPQRALPWRFNGSVAPGPALYRAAECIAYRLRVEFASFAPVPATAMTRNTTAVRLRPAQETLPGRVVWDLNLRRIVPMPLALTLDPLTPVREMISRHGTAPFVREVLVPELSFGKVRVSFFIALPKQHSLASLRAVIYAPSVEGRSAIRTFVDIPLNDDASPPQIILQFKSSERPRFTYHCVVMTKDNRHFEDKEHVTEVTAPQGTKDFPVMITSEALPLHLLQFRGDPKFLSTASVLARLHWGDKTADFAVASTASTIAIPRVADATMSFEATETKRGRRIETAAMPAEHAVVDEFIFPQYALHTIGVSSVFDDEDDELRVTLRAEGADVQTELILTDDNPKANWTYFPKSPFDSGYQYRIGDESWSPVQPYDRDLQLKPM